MFHKFTEGAIKAIMLAQEEARKSGHNYVGTEHLLLGLLAEGKGVATKLLQANLTLEALRNEADKIVPQGTDDVSGDILFSERSKRALEASWDAARELGHNYIGTAHLLLGLLRENNGIGVHAMRSLGVDLDDLKRDSVEQAKLSTSEEGPES